MLLEGNSSINVRDDIKISGRLAIFNQSKIEGEGGKRLIMEKLQLKIETVHHIDVEIIQNYL